MINHLIEFSLRIRGLVVAANINDELGDYLAEMAEEVAGKWEAGE